jgi:hypothetical protein
LMITHVLVQFVLRRAIKVPFLIFQFQFNIRMPWLLISKVTETWYFIKNYIYTCTFNKQIKNYNRGVMVSMLTSSAVYRRFESRSVQTKDYKIGISCFTTKQAVFRRKTKD